ncbi:MAG: sigma-70 family RNA polymerase sigma factor [Mangrovibacterium sp.]|nr:sigma-70 family RNA polymerase sigma factor [Mangrovibacterium sp.]
MEDLSQLIRDCVAGRPTAQARLYQLFAPRMYGVCLRYSRDATEAEDNLQDGFIKVFEKIGTFRHEGSFEGWMRRIMVNVALEKYRKQNPLQTVDDISALEIPDLSEEIISTISANDLLRLIRELPPRYRMVFNLYVFEGMNHKEIAEEMKISDGTSKSNLARARTILKKQIRKYFEHTENNYSA